MEPSAETVCASAGISLKTTHRFGAQLRKITRAQAPQARKMLFTNLTPVSSSGRSAGRFAAFTLVALLAAATATAQSSNPAPAQSNPAPGTAPMQQQPKPPPASRQATSLPVASLPPAASRRDSRLRAPLPLRVTPKLPRSDPARVPAMRTAGMPTAASLSRTDRPARTFPSASTWAVAKGSSPGGSQVISITVSGSPPTSATARALRPSCRTRPTTVRWLMYQTYAGGAQWRGPRNRYVAINYHGFFGAVYGNFDRTIKDVPVRPQPDRSLPRSHRTSGQYRSLLQPHVSVGSYWRQHRLQSGAEVCDPPLARPDLRALRHGDARSSSGFRWARCIAAADN